MISQGGKRYELSSPTIVYGSLKMEITIRLTQFKSKYNKTQ